MPVPIIDFIPLGLSKLRPFKFKGSRIWRLSIKGEYFKKGLLELLHLSSQTPCKSFLSLLKEKLWSISNCSAIVRILSEFGDLRSKFNKSFNGAYLERHSKDIKYLRSYNKKIVLIILNIGWFYHKYELQSTL